MQRTWRPLLLLMLALALLLGACGGEEEAPAPETPAVAEPVSPTDTPTPEPPTPTPEPPTPTPTPEPPTPAPAVPEAESPASEEATSPVYANPIDTLDRFRVRGELYTVTTLPDGTTREESIQMEGAFVRVDNPWGANDYFQITSMGSMEEGPQTVVIYRVDDVAAVQVEDEWLTVSRDEAFLFTFMADIFTTAMDEIAPDLTDAERVGVEEVNGVEAVHYRLTDPELFAMLADIQEEEDGRVESISLDVWVAQEGNYILKYAMEARAVEVPDEDATGQEVRVTQEVRWTFELYDINSPDVEVSLPEGLPKPEEVSVPGFEPGAFPMPEGAEVTGTMFGIIQIATDLSPEEAQTFYEETLADLGWTVEGMAGFYQVSKGETTFSLIITQDEASGRTMIQVYGGEE